MEAVCRWLSTRACEGQRCSHHVLPGRHRKLEVRTFQEDSRFHRSVWRSSLGGKRDAERESNELVLHKHIAIVY